MKRVTAIITIGSILFMSCFGLLKTEIYGVENNKLCDLVELYENDIKFNNQSELSFGDAFESNFNDSSSLGTIFSQVKNAESVESGRTDGDNCIAVSAETDSSGILTKKFSKPILDGVYHFEFDVKVTNPKACYTYIDFSAKSGGGYNTFCIMPQNEKNAALGFFHSKRLWSQSAYNVPIYADKWMHIDMMMDLDTGEITYYADNKKLKLCRYTDLDEAELTGFTIRREIRGSDSGDAVRFDNMKLEKVYGDTAARLDLCGISVDNRLMLNKIRADIVSDSPGNILFNDSSFGAVLYNRSETSVYAAARIFICDSNGKTVYDNSEDLRIGAREKTAIDIPFTNLKYGIYTAVIEMRYDSETVTEKSEFSYCVNAENVRNTKLGINTHMSRTADFGIKNGDVENIGELMSRAGFGITRESLGGQNFYVDSDGMYSSFDEDSIREKAYEDASINRGIGTVQILCGDGSVPFRAYPPITDAEVENYAKYVSDMVHRYKDKVKSWEIWNEYNLTAFNNSLPPNATAEQKTAAACNYAKLLRAAYNAIKAEDSESTVIGFAAAIGLADSSWSGLGFIDLVLKQDPSISDCFDAVSYHYYAAANTCGETSGLVGTLEKLREILDLNGCENKPVWITETGFTTGNYINETSSIGVSETNQANYLIKTLLSVDAHNLADKVMLYGLADKGRSGVYENGFGIVRGTKTEEIPFAAKPAYLAVSNWNRLFADSEFLNLAYDESKRCLAYTYKNSDGTKTAAFYDRDVKTARSKIYLGCDTVTKIDMFGNEQVIKGNGGYFEIDLSDGVAYLKGDFSALKFCDRYTGGYKTVFSDDFEDYTGGNREFYRGINTASAVNTESGTALCTNNKVESESAVIRKIYIKDCKFGGTDKANVSFDLSMPQNPDEYLSQTYIRFRNDSAASDAVTAEQKKKTWLMFADINNGYANTFKVGGAYLDGNYNERLLIQKDTVYRFNIDIDFESKKYDISISDGTNLISSAVENIELSAFDSIEIITVKSDVEYDMSVCIDNITVQKYFEQGKKLWEIEYIDASGKNVEYINDAVGDTITVKSRVNSAELLKNNDSDIIAAVYDNGVLVEIKVVKNSESDSIVLNLPEDKTNAEIKVFMWNCLSPIGLYGFLSKYIT